MHLVLERRVLDANRRVGGGKHGLDAAEVVRLRRQVGEARVADDQSRAAVTRHVEARLVEAAAYEAHGRVDARQVVDGTLGADSVLGARVPAVRHAAVEGHGQPRAAVRGPHARVPQHRVDQPHVAVSHQHDGPEERDAPHRGEAMRLPLPPLHPQRHRLPAAPRPAADGRPPAVADKMERAGGAGRPADVVDGRGGASLQAHRRVVGDTGQHSAQVAAGRRLRLAARRVIAPSVGDEPRSTQRGN